MDPRIRRELCVLKWHAMVSTLLLVTFVALAASNQRDREKVGEIDVERINVVEPDGTLRMVISNKTAFPGIIVKGKEYPHPGRQDAAGMLFYNDEGTENGGLTFGGKKDEKGHAQSFGHLSFDAYEQDQLFTVDAVQDGTKRYSSLRIADQPNWPITDILGLPPDERQHAASTKPTWHARIYLGRGDDKSVALKLKDAEGRDRLIIRVAAEGSPTIQFLDATGKVLAQFPEQPKK
jgi:hypothetical protein